MLLHHIHTFFQQHTRPPTVWVGLSGGADSVALLHALTRYRQMCSGSLNLAAIHVHHGLNENADMWADFCANLCHQYAVPLTIERVQIDASNLGVEAAARAARYRAFSKNIGSGSLILAHHADDQVETVLLAMLRGGGLRALAAMPQTRVSGSLNVLRPFLNVSRAEIEQYIQQHQLTHIHDTSNDCTDFLRNWVRHDLLPHIQNRVPDIRQHILGSIEVLQDELSVVNQVLAQDWQDCCHNGIVSRLALLRLSAARQKAVLLKFCEIKQLGLPRKSSLNDFMAHLPNSAQHIWSLPHGAIWLYRDKLWAWHHHQQKQYLSDTQNFSGSLNRAPQLTWQAAPRGLAWADLNCDAIVRPYRTSDTLITPLGRKSVVKLLQDKKIPPALRHNWLVVEMAGKCVAVANIAVCESVAVANGWLPEWQLTLPFVSHRLD